MTTAGTVGLILLVLHIVLGFAAAIVISLYRKPSTAIAWILAIVFIPYLSLLAFFLVGFGRLPRRRREKQQEVNGLMLQRSSVIDYRVEPTEPDWLRTAVALNENLGTLPMVSGNTMELLDDYRGSIEAMAADIDTATEYVHVEFYILICDDTTRPFFDALARAVERGVKVRVLSDYLAGLSFREWKPTRELLASMGAQWHPMLPLNPFRGQWQRPDMRNHRKLVVVDGRVGFTGSQNMVDSSYHKPKNLRRGLHWIELMTRVRGPLVGELEAVFVTDWFSETDELLPVGSGEAGEGGAVGVIDAQVIPSGPSFENDNNLKLFVMLIHNARRRVSIASPYFVPDEATLMALVTAASRGLEVELFVSEVGDQAMVYHAQRSYYSELLDAGVAIYRYHAPTVLHSKHFTIDEDVAVIGSSNMDIRSFSLNMEVSVLVRSAEFVSAMKVVEDDYRANSARLDPVAWRGRSLGGKILDGLARLTSALQ